MEWLQNVGVWLSKADSWVIMAGIATAFFTGYAVFQRWLHGARPMWRATFDSYASLIADEHSVRTVLRIVNVGNGTAFDVALFEGKEEVGRWAQIESGKECFTQLTCGVRYEGVTTDSHGNAIEYLGPVDWGTRKMSLIWTQPPRLRRVRHRAFGLRDVPGLRSPSTGG